MSIRAPSRSTPRIWQAASRRCEKPANCAPAPSSASICSANPPTGRHCAKSPPARKPVHPRRLRAELRRLAARPPPRAAGDATATSFFPSKPLGAYGDGGALFTESADRASLYRSLRTHGEGTQRYEVLRTGMNGRLDTMQAAVLLAKLTCSPRNSPTASHRPRL
jgi:hypothetical protein